MAQMDDIVFEYRNKSYGAYILRKKYNIQLTRALLLASAILLAGLAYPLVSSYIAVNKKGHFINDGTVTVFTPPKPEDFTPPPSPPPPPTADLEKRIAFVAPEVIEGEVIDNVDPFNMDDINNSTSNVMIDVSFELPRVKQDQTIEIPEEKKEIFITAEEMPSYTGGEAERIKFLHDHIQYPQLAAEISVEGTVYIRFVVDSKGNITDAFVLRGIGGGCDEEALRVVKAMPQWHPGKQNGKAVRVLFTMPIMFKLQNN